MNVEISKKQELINIAGELFYTKGYSKTSIQNIIDRANIAKGTFYHYFKSKEDLLTSFTDTQVSALYVLVNKILEEDIPATNKFSKLFQSASNWKNQNAESIRFLMKIMTSESNLILRHNMLQQQIKKLAPIYKSIIDQGIEEGSFIVNDSEYTASFLLNSFSGFGDMVYGILDAPVYTGEILDQFRVLMKNFEDSLERLLGIKEGTIHVVDDVVLEELLKGLLEA
ncbi:MAG: TetR/AcrR family transcriptional regulator [Spirochaetaceae bacterium]